jgi:hypothetical protein
MVLESQPLDALCFGEHWLKPAESDIVRIESFTTAESFTRSNHTHGGVIQFILSCHQFESLQFVKSLSSEIDCEIIGTYLPEFNLYLIVVYRSPLGKFEVLCENICKVLDVIDYKDKNVVFGGDFNIHFNLKNENVQQLTDLFSSFGLYALVDFPTRNNSHIDNVFTNIPCDFVRTSPLETDFSDHTGVLVQVKNCFFNRKCKMETKRVRPITLYGKFIFYHCLDNIDWDFLAYDFDINHKFDMFLNNILSIFNTAFPEQMVTFKRNSKVSCSNNWFNSNLQKMRETLGLLNDAYKLHETIETKQLLSSFKKRYLGAIKEAKMKANECFVRHNKGNPKALWSIINQHKPKKDLQCTITANEFNDYFSSIVDKIISSLPTATDSPINIMRSTNVTDAKCNGFFYFHEVSEVEVRDVIKQLKNNNTKDIFGFSTSLVKTVQNCLISPITKLFNCAVKQGLFPDQLKKAAVAPIFKKGDAEDVNNYRPISVLPIFSKIFERLMLSQIIKFLDNNKLLTPYQFGFRKNYSTTSAILHLTCNILNSFEQNEFYHTYFLDLTKAFDCVSHELLIKKLLLYNFHPASTKFILSFLSDRTQIVRTNGSYSVEKKIIHGVPQGSILGPIIFLIFINDLPGYLSNKNVTMYADDTTVSNKAKSLTELLIDQKNLLTLTENWFISNKLTLNKEKTISIIFTLKNYATAETFSNVTKYLGVFIDKQLNWNKHGDEVATKISKNLYLLRNLSDVLSQQYLKIAYYALIQSHLQYAILAWGHSPSRHRLFRLQRRAIRIIAKLGYKDDCHEYFQKLNILTLPCLYIYKCLEHIIKNLDSYPTLGAFHDYHTRAEAISFKTIRLSKSKDGINYFCIKFFNKLPVKITKTINEKMLLSKIKSYLIEKSFYSFEEFLENKFTDFT